MSNIQRKQAQHKVNSSSAFGGNHIPPPHKGDSAKEESKRMTAYLREKEGIPNRRFNYGSSNTNKAGS